MLRSPLVVGRSRTVVIGAAVVGLTYLLGFQFGNTANAQRLDTPRIPPVQKADWSDAQRALLQPFEESGEFVNQNADDGQLFNVLTTVANHPDLMPDFLAFSSYVLRRNTLPPRDREMLILRIGWLCQSEYEWSQHVVVGKSVGLTDDDIQHVMDGPSASGLSENDRLLLLATDELHNDSHVSDATWDALSEIYSTEQMMDLVFTVGQYNLVSMALNSFGVQLDEGFEGFPE